MNEPKKPKNKLCIHWLDCEKKEWCPHGRLHKDVAACHGPCVSGESTNEECLTVNVERK